jgi:hypothetical protein
LDDVIDSKRAAGRDNKDVRALPYRESLQDELRDRRPD